MKKQILSIEERQQQLKTYLLKIAPTVNKIELDELIASFEIADFPKKYLILREGDFSENLYFVCKGLIRNYYIKEGKEINHWITNENMLLTAAYTIATGNKNFINYETLEDTYTLKIKYTTLTAFYSKYHSLEHLGRKIVELYYGAFMKKTFDVLFLSAEERYHAFMKEHGDLINRVPLRIIASYIGLTQETLSRIRAYTK
jgi:CRP-like cAMP-binding protein